jgi:hypothetical protein
MTTTLPSKFVQLLKLKKTIVIAGLLVGGGYGLLEVWYAGFTEGWRQAQVATDSEGNKAVPRAPVLLIRVSGATAL